MYKLGFMFWCMMSGACTALLLEGYKDLGLTIGLLVSIWYVVKMKDNVEVKKKAPKLNK